MSLKPMLVMQAVLSSAGADSTLALRGSNVSSAHLRSNDTSIVLSVAASVANQTGSHQVIFVGNTTGRNMSLQVSSMDGWPFKLGPSCTMNCPDRYAKITSEDECLKAAEYYGWIYSGKFEREDWPGNCFMGPYPRVYFNSFAGTGCAFEGNHVYEIKWEPMCIHRPGTNSASSKGCWPFKMASSDETSCPTGYAEITTEDECSQAAKYYTWPYSGKVEREDLPKNCFMGPYPRVYFNSVARTGGSLEKGWERMCIRRPAAARSTNDTAESHEHTALLAMRSSVSVENDTVVSSSFR